MFIDRINTVLSGVWPDWHVDEELGAGSYGAVYRARRDTPEGREQAAIKVIPVPGNEAEVDAFLAEGNNELTAKVYFQEIATGCLDEARLMEGLRDAPNVVHIQDSALVPHPNGIGWDVYIRMELLTPFTFWLAEHQPLPAEDIFRLGMDISRALSACASVHVLHRDVKPENIFVSDDGRFKLGDFGVARRLSGTASVLSQKGTYNYMAPEVYNNQHYTETADIYSLGLVLYRLSNRGRAPFLPLDKQIVSYSERNAAVKRRMEGEEIPAPADAGPALSAVIAKACRFAPEERYASAGDMASALEMALEAVRKGPDAEERFARKAMRAGKGGAVKLRAAAACASVITLAAVFLVLGHTSSVPRDPGQASPEVSADLSRVIDWGDDALRDAMRETLQTDGDILLGDVWQLTSLSLRDKGIRDISALAELKDLDYLDLSGNDIEDASALSALTGLEYLDLSGNPVTDIRFVSGMDALRDLSLTGCSVADLGPLAGLGGLETLRLAGNPADDLSVLEVLTGLTVLDVSDTGFTDCAVVSGLPLTEFYADNDRLQDVDALAGFSSLKRLSLSGTGLSELGFLSGMAGLSWLELEGNDIEDITPLADLESLTQCSMAGNRIVDTASLSGLVRLEYLDLRRNRLTAESLEALSGLSALTYLDLSGNQIEGSLDALSGLSSLTWLSIRDNALTDISAVRDLPLTAFYWAGNPVSDLSVIEGLHLVDHD